MLDDVPRRLDDVPVDDDLAHPPAGWRALPGSPRRAPAPAFRVSGASGGHPVPRRRNRARNAGGPRQYVSVEGQSPVSGPDGPSGSPAAAPAHGAHPGAAPGPQAGADVELEAGRLRVELAIDAAQIGSFDWDLTTGRLGWDDRMLQIFGYERASFDGTIEAFFARCHSEDRDRTRDAVQSAIDTCGDYSAEFRVVLPSGETRWVQGRGRGLAGEDGMAVRLLGAAYDTTRQQEGEARVTRVLEAMNAAFFALDREDRFTYVNAESERVLARTREELLGRSIWEAFPGTAESPFGENYRAAADTGREWVFESYYPPFQAWYEVRAWPGPDGLSVYFLDVTERRAAEESARRSAARLAVVAEASSVMSGTLTTGRGEEAALQRVAEASVPVLGDWVILSLVDEDGRIRDVGSWHRDPEGRPLVARYAELRLAALGPNAPVMRALASGQL